jgi:hypothetical protein
METQNRVAYQMYLHRVGSVYEAHDHLEALSISGKLVLPLFFFMPQILSINMNDMTQNFRGITYFMIFMKNL